MPAVQSVYNERMSVAVAGMPADMQNWNAVTRTCETSAGIGFGLACGRGDDDPEKTAKLGGALVDFLGVSTRDITLEARASIDEYQEGENMGILDHGTIWVQVSDDPTSDSAVHYDTTTGVFKSSGGIGPVVGARFVGSVVADPNGVDIIKLKLPAIGQAAA